MSAPTPVKEWISARGAALRLGITRWEVQKLAMVGKIATRAEPGRNLKFRAADVERLAAERAESESA